MVGFYYTNFHFEQFLINLPDRLLWYNIIEVMHKPFTGKKIYYSGSLTGTPEFDLQFPKQLVAFMENNGAHVLDPHVAISPQLKGEREAYFENLGLKYNLSLNDWNNLTYEDQDKTRYTYFINLLDEATHVVALLNGPTTGVGMEIEHALLKPKLSLNGTPILGLVHKDKREMLSPMIRGAAQVYDHFYLKTYTSVTEAHRHIQQFLFT